MKYTKPPFRGCATALVTPLRDGVPDLPALGTLLERQIAAHLEATVVLGTTGEAATLTEKERDTVLSYTVQKADGRISVLCGTGSNDTARALRYTRRARELGADGALVVTPYYNKGTTAGIRTHFLSVADIGLPIILYNIPSRTGVSLSVEDILLLAEHPCIAGLKEASGDVQRVAELKRAAPAFPIYSGNDQDLLPILSYGGDGVISVLSNLFPAQVDRICRLFFAGQCAEARECFFRFLPLLRALFAETNPAPVKYALSLEELCLPEVRLPLSLPAEATRMALCRQLTLLKNE